VNVKSELGTLVAWWTGLPPEVRAHAGEAWGGALYLLGEGCRIVGARLEEVKGPLLFLFMEGFRTHVTAAALAALRKQPAPPNPVIVEVERELPGLVKFLTTITEALGLSAPASNTPHAPGG